MNEAGSGGASPEVASLVGLLHRWRRSELTQLRREMFAAVPLSRRLRAGSLPGVITTSVLDRQHQVTVLADMAELAELSGGELPSGSAVLISLASAHPQGRRVLHAGEAEAWARAIVGPAAEIFLLREDGRGGGAGDGACFFVLFLDSAGRPGPAPTGRWRWPAPLQPLSASTPPGP